jgi:hypothetical protein
MLVEGAPGTLVQGESITAIRRGSLTRFSLLRTARCTRRTEGVLGRKAVRRSNVAKVVTGRADAR